MTFVGPVVLDVCQHFVERWNEIKKRKVRPILTAGAIFMNADRICPPVSQRSVSPSTDCNGRSRAHRR